MAHAQGSHLAQQFGHKGTMDARLHDQPRRGGATLAGLPEGTVQTGRNGKRKIGVVHHHHRAFATHFRLKFLHPFGTGQRQPAPGGDRAGKGYSRDIRVLRHRRADARSRTHDQVEDTCGAACRMNDLRQQMRGAGGKIGGLHHHRISIGQRRGGLPGRDGDGKVPRRDQADHPQRLSRHLDIDALADRGDGIAFQP